MQSSVSRDGTRGEASDRPHPHRHGNQPPITRPTAPRRSPVVRQEVIEEVIQSRNFSDLPAKVLVRLRDSFQPTADDSSARVRELSSIRDAIDAEIDRQEILLQEMNLRLAVANRPSRPPSAAATRAANENLGITFEYVFSAAATRGELAD